VRVVSQYVHLEGRPNLAPVRRQASRRLGITERDGGSHEAM
jgi:hypothetical protein